jgi:hypothetical protein
MGKGDVGAKAEPMSRMNTLHKVARLMCCKFYKLFEAKSVNSGHLQRQKLQRREFTQDNSTVKVPVLLYLCTVYEASNPNASLKEQATTGRMPCQRSEHSQGTLARTCMSLGHGAQPS